MTTNVDLQDQNDKNVTYRTEIIIDQTYRTKITIQSGPRYFKID